MTRQETHIARREPDRVMTLKRLGSLHQCRLSFMRVLTRRMANEAWTFSRNKFDIDDNGVGCAVYTATCPTRSYSLVAFAHEVVEEHSAGSVLGPPTTGEGETAAAVQAIGIAWVKDAWVNTW